MPPPRTNYMCISHLLSQRLGGPPCYGPKRHLLLPRTHDSWVQSGDSFSHPFIDPERRGNPCRGAAAYRMRNMWLQAYRSTPKDPSQNNVPPWHRRGGHPPGLRFLSTDTMWDNFNASIKLRWAIQTSNRQQQLPRCLDGAARGSTHTQSGFCTNSPSASHSITFLMVKARVEKCGKSWRELVENCPSTKLL